MSGWHEGTSLATGATSVVRRGAPGTVVKTLLPEMPAVLAQREVAATGVAEEAGLPVARLLASDLHATPPTLTFSYVDAPMIAVVEQLGGQRIGHILADLHARIHRVSVPSSFLTAQRFFAHQLAQAPLTDAARARALADLETLPTGRTLCHMDLHPRNVLWNGSPTVIDWSDAVAWVPEADVARTRRLLDGAVIDADEASHRAHVEAVRDGYAERTEELRPGLIDASRAWDRLIASARLDERPSAREREALRAWVE